MNSRNVFWKWSRYTIVLTRSGKGFRSSVLFLLFLINLYFTGSNTVLIATEAKTVDTNLRKTNQSDEIVIGFEDGTLGKWKIIEGKFDRLISDRETFHNRPSEKYNKQGKYYLSTVEQQPGKPSLDRMTGIIESPVYRLSKQRISMYIGSGTQEKCYIGLYTLDGKEQYRFHGKHVTETMFLIEKDFPKLVGKMIYFRIVDQETRGWGHITCDDIRFCGTYEVDATEERAKIKMRSELDLSLARLNNDLLTFQKIQKDYQGRNKESRPSFDKDFQMLKTEIRQLKIDSNATEKVNQLRNKIESLQNTVNQAIKNVIVESSLFDIDENDENVGNDGNDENIKRHKNADSNDVVLYVLRHPYRSHYHAIDTLFNSDEFNENRREPHKNLFTPDASLKLLALRSNREISLVKTPNGSLRDPDLDFNTSRIVFSLRKNRDSDYQIWELSLKNNLAFSDLLKDPIYSEYQSAKYTSIADGDILVHPMLNLRQLTKASLVADFDPIYLPNGQIVFSSTREPKYNMCSRDLASDLYRMNGDGSNICQITKCTLFEHNPVLLPDGRICYHRWEYVDRNFGDAHGLWTVRPDGQNQSLYWGNNTSVPGAVYNPNPISETDEMLCIFGPHHGNENGALAIIDRRLGLEGPASVVKIWPESFRKHLRIDGGFDCDTSIREIDCKYEDPFVIDSDHFLVSRQCIPGGLASLYIVDRNDNIVELKRESPGIYDPILVKVRSRPPILESHLNYEKTNGTCYIINVYEGTHMKNVKKGDVHFLRVVESPEKRNFSLGQWNGQGYTAPAMNWHSLENKRILGTVPVEKDGSVAFNVPSDTFIYFQLLDEKGRMIQTMRSGTVLQPGETITCIGCHEDRLAIFPNAVGTRPLAMNQSPKNLEIWNGPVREFGYMNEVQPIFDKYCVECHDFDKPAGEKLNLAADRDLVFNASYQSLWLTGQIACIGGGPAELLETGRWGSRVSPLIHELDQPKIKEHIDAKLKERISDEDIKRLATWIDLNGVYYPFYESAWPESISGRTPLNNDELARLSSLIGDDLFRRMGFNDFNRGGSEIKGFVSFDRPEKSPVLKRLTQKMLLDNKTMTVEKVQQTEQYRQALELILLGKKRLKETPRADMNGFVPSIKDKERLKKYMFRQEEEKRFRRALSNGTKAYDTSNNESSELKVK